VLALLCLTGAVRLAAVSDGSGFFALPDSIWPVPGTVLAISGQDTLGAMPGAMGSRPGITVSPAPARGDSVLLVFETAPLTVSSSAALEVPAVDREAFTLGTSLSPDYAPQGLFISGSKRLGISVGDGPAVDQSTRLSLSGSLAPGITVEGSITDENLPVGTGSSELVSELDKVLLEVSGRRWGARLGDQEWLRPGTGPLAWSRELSGASARIDSTGGFGAAAGAGVSGQSSDRVVFFTLEGVQGPYDLSDGEEIVPGSEEIYLDGILMRRGDSGDYTIDYAVGQITFTARRLIRRDSRVEAIYYGRGAGYRKDLYTATAEAFTGDLRLELTGLAEADSRDDPLGFAMSDEAIQALQQAGEDPDGIWIDGATYVGDGEGSYSMDSLGHYVYEGPGLGGWRVVFARPPQGYGDYVYDSALGGFAWAGQEEGTHLPRQYLDVPSSVSVGGVSGSAGGEGLFFDFESAISRRIGNTFNPEGTTREGGAFAGTLGFRPLGGGLLLGVRSVAVTDGFRQAGTWEADSSLRSWSLPPGYEGRDDLVEAFGSWGWGSVSAGTRLPAGGGSLLRARGSMGFAGGPLDYTASASGTKRSSTALMAEGNVVRSGAGASLRSGMIRPSIGVALLIDDWADSLSGGQTSLLAGSEFTRSMWNGEVLLESTFDGREGPVPVPYRVYRGRLSLTGGGGGWGLGGSFEHSRSLWESGGRSEADAISVNASASSGTTWLSASYSGSGVLSSSLEVHYRYAGEGQGSWSFDEGTGQYYPDPDGDYEIYYLPGEGGDLVASASLETDLSTGGAEGAGLEISADLTSQGTDRARAFLLAGAFGDGPGGYDLEISPFWRSSSGTVRLLRARGTISRDRAAYSGSGYREESERGVELLEGLGLGPLVRIDLQERLRRREEDLQSARKIDELRISADPSVSLRGGAEPGLLAGFEKRSEAYLGITAYMYELKPHFRWNGGGWSAWASAGGQYIPGDASIPLWLYDGNKQGLNLLMQARLTRRLSEQFDVSLTWYARRPAGAEWTQRAGLEGTVTF
jgi:hypothetical protein